MDAHKDENTRAHQIHVKINWKQLFSPWVQECWRVFLMLLQRILMTVEMGLSMLLCILSSSCRNRNKRSSFNSKLYLSYLIFFFIFPLVIFYESSFVLWSSSCFHFGPNLSIDLLHFCVSGFCFASCSKDLHFDLEGREENE